MTCPLEYYKIEEGIFKAKYTQNLVVDLEVAKEVFKLREEVCKGESYPTYWDCREVKYWTKEARDFQMSELNNRLIVAGAALYTESYAITITVNFFLKFNTLPFPARFFTNEADAIEWLRQFVK